MQLFLVPDSFFGGFPGSSVGKQSACNTGDPVPVRSLSQEDPLEEEMATHPSILAWRILCVLLLQKLLVSMQTLQQEVPGPRSEMGQGLEKQPRRLKWNLKHTRTAWHIAKGSLLSTLLTQTERKSAE